MSRINVALIGVGNCASSLVQGVEFYTDMKSEEEAVGLRSLFLKSYHPRDIRFVSAFDIETRKVGSDLSEAIFASPNNTLKVANVPVLKVKVQRGPVLDGVGASVKDIIQIADSPEVDVVQKLRESGAEIAVNLLPSGAIEASTWYAEKALEAGCALINATPAPIACNVGLGKRFNDAGLPLVGDDLVDQVGATALHKTLLKLLVDRGVSVCETYQLDVGGGAESLDTLDRTREMKRTVKTRAVKTVLPDETSVVAGSTDYVDFLRNRRDSYFWVKGLYFGAVPMQLDMRLNTVDGPNAGSVLLDVIRAVKIALDEGISGPLVSVSAYAFKSPPQMMPLCEAEQMFRAFISSGR
ncbi:MAG: inositol-3-phosphate synthase [Candidatus Bathyarchaeota archaeon]|nr:MAG: inositol-3-phosphate synthase [Candidatus Bathyarchaeota archaeon]